jgi:hypothetical protein
MAPVRAILKAATIENAVVVMTRHVTPVPLVHMRLSGPTGKQMMKHVTGEPPNCYLEGLHDWSTVPALAKQPGGEPLHYYLGKTAIPPLWKGPNGEDVNLAARKALAESRGPWDLWINARGYKHVNGTRRDGGLFCGVEVEPEFLNVFSAAAVAFRDDQDSWAGVSDQYKLINEDGSAWGPRADLDAAPLWVVLSQPEPAP